MRVADAICLDVNVWTNDAEPSRVTLTLHDNLCVGKFWASQSQRALYSADTGLGGHDESGAEGYLRDHAVTTVVVCFISALSVGIDAAQYQLHTKYEVIMFTTPEFPDASAISKQALSALVCRDCVVGTAIACRSGNCRPVESARRHDTERLYAGGWCCLLSEP